MGRSRGADDSDLLAKLAVLLAALVFALAVRRSTPLAEITPDVWRCTAFHGEQEPVDTAQGVTYRTVQACDQWTKR